MNPNTFYTLLSWQILQTCYPETFTKIEVTVQPSFDLEIIETIKGQFNFGHNGATPYFYVWKQDEATGFWWHTDPVLKKYEIDTTKIDEVFRNLTHEDWEYLIEKTYHII